jgi:MFS family permease
VREPTTTLRPLVLLEGATLLSGAGNGVAMVVLPWLVLDLTGSAASAGLLAAATALPLLASSLFSGTVVDTVGRRRTSIGSDLLSAAAVAAIPLLDRAVGLSLGLLIALAVIGAVFDPAGVTARESMLPAAAERSGWPLAKVNGIHEAIWNVAFIVGPGIGGVLIATVGARDALWIITVAFLASAGLVAALRVPNAGPPVDGDAPDGLWTGTRDGLRFVASDRLLRAITLLSAALISVYLPIEGVLLPVHFEALDQPGRLGGIVMAMSLGGIVGALGYSAVGTGWRRSRVFRGALVLTVAFVGVLALLPPYPAMLGAAFVVGVAYGPIGPLVNLAIQARSTEAMRGRVVGVITSAEYAAGPLGYLVVGAATSRFGVEATFLSVAAALLLVAVAGWFVRPLGELDDLVEPEVGQRTLGEALDVATAGPLPLVQPPRDPEALRRR